MSRQNQTLAELDPTVLEALAGIDGAVVTDLNGRLLTFGAILKIDPEALKIARAVEGARTLAAIAASYHGPVLKVSEDGYLTMYLGGRRVWGIVAATEFTRQGFSRGEWAGPRAGTRCRSPHPQASRALWIFAFPSTPIRRWSSPW